MRRRYLKRAFWIRLGRIPVNVLAVMTAVITGFAHPAIWIAGLALEIAFLAGLSSNERFRKLVDAELEARDEGARWRKLRELISRLDSPMRARMATLESRVNRARKLYEEEDDILSTTNVDALDRLSWTYLKLLLWEQNLNAASASDDELTKEIAKLENELARDELSDELRDSKQATLEILRRRLELHGERGSALAQIESDLGRIEAQVELALESVGMRGRPAAISADLNLASRLFEIGDFGDDQLTVEEVDRTFEARQALE